MDLTSYLLGKKASGGGGGGDLDWTAIGYSGKPQTLNSIYNYSKQVYDNYAPESWARNKYRNDYNLVIAPLVDTSIATDMNGFFYGCSALIQIPLLDTSKVTNIGSFCYGCKILKYVPKLDISSAKYIGNMFANCEELTDESLDNILQMCIGAISSVEDKKLSTLGFSSTNYPVSKIQALPHYQAFINAGWTIGY